MALKISFNTKSSDIFSINEKHEKLLLEEFKKGHIRNVADIEKLLIDNDSFKISDISLNVIEKHLEIEITNEKGEILFKK